MNNVQIIRARVKDAPAIAQILHDAFISYKDLYTIDGYNATVISAEQIQERMEQGPVWIAVQNELSGTVSVLMQEKEVYIRSMAVLPSKKGQRIGRMLLTRIEQFALEAKATCLKLSTAPFLDTAIYLYQDFGFRRTEAGPKDLHGTPLFTMVKEL